MHGAAAFPVQVLGEVRQQREVAEGPDDGEGVVGGDVGEHRREFGAVDLGAAHAEALDAGAFDEGEEVLAGLFADDAAQHPAEQPDVLAQRFGGGAGPGGVGRAGGIRHPVSIAADARRRDPEVRVAPSCAVLS